MTKFKREKALTKTKLAKLEGKRAVVKNKLEETKKKLKPIKKSSDPEKIKLSKNLTMQIQDIEEKVFSFLSLKISVLNLGIHNFWKSVKGIL